MRQGARHQRQRLWTPLARRAGRARTLWHAARLLLPAVIAGGLMALPAMARSLCIAADGAHIRKVCLGELPDAPTYGHAVLGDTPEWDVVTVIWGREGKAAAKAAGKLASGSAAKGLSSLSQAGHIFEDIAPRLVDLDGDGRDEIILVQSSFDSGARLIALSTKGGLSLLAATDYIGRPRRWLAPLGAADLDGDGRMEIAYVETPHLGKRLKVVRLKGARLVPVAMAAGLTNHRIGDAFIQGGIALCDGQPTVITADAGWRRIIGTTLSKGTLLPRDLGPYAGPESLKPSAHCR
ncbi:MAG: VCBS repeat-containing protein [Paracoccaceae bacterium]